MPTSKVGRHIPCMYSISRIWTFDYWENKHSLYLRESLNEKVLWIFKRKCKKYNWLWKEKCVSVNNKKLKLHQGATECCICKNSFITKLAKKKIFEKLKANAMVPVNVEAQKIVLAI